MALEIPDLVIGFAAIVLAAFVIYMFVQATGGFKPGKKEEPEEPEKEAKQPEPIKVNIESSRVRMPKLEAMAKGADVENARSSIRMLTLKQEIISMVMKRLFEAEDENEISREEREALSKGYEAEMQQVQDELDRAELIVSLNELETIRTDIIQQFEATLTETQLRIDQIIKELKLEPPVEEEPKPKPTPRRAPRRRPRPQPTDEEEPTEEEEEDQTRRRETVEDRLDKLKEDVLKELEELDRLELEA
jgi:hypothetical protein